MRLVTKCLKAITVLMLILVLGWHWAVIQSAAWVWMAANYSRNAPWKEALVKTLDGKHPCAICTFVAEGKKNEKQQDQKTPPVKQDLLLTACASRLFPPTLLEKHRSTAWLKEPRSEAPPTPPPRAV